MYRFPAVLTIGSAAGYRPRHKKMILCRKYSLFYFLTFMDGARRQISGRTADPILRCIVSPK